MRGDLPVDGIFCADLNEYTSGCGTTISNVHPESQCEGRPCTIHNPTIHAMRSFPTHVRIPGLWDIKPLHIERICPHGVGHPDPDDMWYHINVRNDPSMGVHGCDGCCKEEA